MLPTFLLYLVLLFVFPCVAAALAVSGMLALSPRTRPTAKRVLAWALGGSAGAILGLLLGGLPVVSALMVYGFSVNYFGHAVAVNTSWVAITVATITLAIPAVATVVGTVLGVGVGANVAAGMPLRQAVAKIRTLRI